MKTNTVKLGADGHVTVSVSGSFNFESARPILLECKSHLNKSISRITVSLDGVTYIDSCGIGVISVLQDLVGVERFSLDLGNCAPQVRHLFESNVLANFVNPSTLRRCATCFDTVKIACKMPSLIGCAVQQDPEISGKRRTSQQPISPSPTTQFRCQN